MRKEIEFTPETPIRISIAAFISLLVSLVFGGITIGVVKSALSAGGSDMDLKLEKRLDQVEYSVRQIERMDQKLNDIKDRMDRDYRDNHRTSAVVSTISPKPQS